MLKWQGRWLLLATMSCDSISPAWATVSNVTTSRHRPHVIRPRREKEILLAELSPGMVLAKGIYAANGLLLIPSGQVLSEPYIDKLRNHNRVNPIRQTLLVYC